MLVEAVRLLFCGPTSVLEAFFKKMQSLGCVEFTNASYSKNLEDNVKVLDKAIKYLSKLGVVSVSSFGILPQSKSLSIAFSINDSLTKLNLLNNELLRLNDEISNLLPIANVSFDKLDELCVRCGLRYRLVRVKQKDWDLCSLDSAVEIVRDDIFVYAADFYVSRPNLHNSFEEVSVSVSKGALYCKRDAVSEDINKLVVWHKSLSKELYSMSVEKENTLDLIDRIQAIAGIKECEGIFFVTNGWCPSVDVKKVYECSELVGVYVERVIPNEREVVPTIMRNSGLGKIGQDLVEIYDIPSASDKDPSLWVFGFFVLFFSAIVGDAGYGLILLIASSFLMFKCRGLSGKASRMLRLSLILGISTLLFGLVSGNVFSVCLSRYNLLRKVSFVEMLAKKKTFYHMQNKDKAWQGWVESYPDVQQERNLEGLFYFKDRGKDSFPISEPILDSVMKEVSVILGIIHLSCSMIRYGFRKPLLFGWCLSMFFAFVLCAKFLGAVTVLQYVFGLDMDFVSFVSEIMLTVSLVVVHVLAILERGFLSGIMEWMTVVQVFSDTLSYLRIYALSFAGSMVALTCNSIAFQSGYAIGLPILLLGHSINFCLGIMGGVVHGLRLNFLEWYHYSFEGGGKLFRPLMFRKNDVDY